MKRGLNTWIINSWEISFMLFKFTKIAQFWSISTPIFLLDCIIYWIRQTIFSSFKFFAKKWYLGFLLLLMFTNHTANSTIKIDAIATRKWTCHVWFQQKTKRVRISTHHCLLPRNVFTCKKFPTEPRNDPNH